MYFRVHFDFSDVTILSEWWRINHCLLADVLSTVVSCDFKLTGEQTLCRISLPREEREKKYGLY